MSNNLDLTFLPGCRKRLDYQCFARKAFLAFVCVALREHKSVPAFIFALDRNAALIHKWYRSILKYGKNKIVEED